MFLKKQPVTFVLIAALGAAAFTGCGTTAGYKQVDRTGEGIADFRTEIVNGSKAIDATVKALNDIATSATTDPRKAFEAYSKSVDKLESAADRVTDRAKTIQADGKTYFANWEKQLSEVKNPEIRELAVQRKARLQETFARIKEVVTPLKSQFNPWLSDLKDLQKYLSNDLTVAGIDAAKLSITKAQNQGADVQRSIQAVVSELNSVAAAITPASAPKK
jgi:uncharacterized phage infection (PIP) family protein YhgE